MDLNTKINKSIIIQNTCEFSCFWENHSKHLEKKENKTLKNFIKDHLLYQPMNICTHRLCVLLWKWVNWPCVSVLLLRIPIHLDNLRTKHFLSFFFFPCTINLHSWFTLIIIQYAAIAAENSCPLPDTPISSPSWSKTLQKSLHIFLYVLITHSLLNPLQANLVVAGWYKRDFSRLTRTQVCLEWV